MSFANHNILDIALSLIPPTVVQIRKNLGTAVNKYGQSEASYSKWIEVYGIVQPGSEQNEHTQGVDFSKKRVTIWLRGIALDGTHIQWAPDQIRYVGSIFNVVSVKDWFPYDNYRECECVEAMNLGADQRGIVDKSEPSIGKRKHRFRKVEDLKQQMLPLVNTTPAALPELPTPPSSESPVNTTSSTSKTKADAPSESESPNTEVPIPAVRKSSLVGKKKIKI